MSAGRLSTLMCALALTLAACAGGADPSVVSPSPSVVSTASPEPTPTATPIDIAGEFASQIGAITELASEVSGALTIGDVDGEISGYARLKDSDSHSLTVITIPGQPAAETEVIVADGVRYERAPTGIWMQMQAEGGGSVQPDPVTEALSRADDLEVVGTEEIGGVTLHRLESNRPVAVEPQALGLTDPSVADFEAAVAFLAQDDGTPAGIVINAAWTQGPAEASIAAEIEMQFLFAIGAAVTIKAPPDPWIVYESAELGYRMAYPVDWDITHDPASEGSPAGDLFVGPIDGEVQVYRYDEIPAELTRNIWFQGSARVVADQFGAQPELVEEMTLANGLEVQVLNLEVEEQGVLYFFQKAVIFGGPVAWDMVWYSRPGYEADALARFVNFVSSFEPTEG